MYAFDFRSFQPNCLLSFEIETLLIWRQLALAKSDFYSLKPAAQRFLFVVTFLVVFGQAHFVDKK